MAMDFDEIKQKVTDGIEDLKKSDFVDKVSTSAKDVAGKVKDGAKDLDLDKLKDKSEDLLEGIKKTLKRASKEVNEKLDKLKR